MLKIPSYICARIATMAATSPQEEIGGVLLGYKGGILPQQVINVACDRAIAYIPSPVYIAEYERANLLCGMWHTHINGNGRFSAQDITSIWQQNVPWLLYDLMHDAFVEFDPIHRPLLGREWELGLNDCWSAVRDFYKYKFDIDLPQPEPPPQKWSDPTWNRALERLPEHFDRRLSGDLQAYDLLLYHSVYGANPAHVAIAIPMADGLKIYHHPYARLSLVEELPAADRAHSIWKPKCPIPPRFISDCLGYWAIDSDDLTWCEPPNSAKQSPTSATTSRISSGRF